MVDCVDIPEVEQPSVAHPICTTDESERSGLKKPLLEGRGLSGTGIRFESATSGLGVTRPEAPRVRGHQALRG